MIELIHLKKSYDSGTPLKDVNAVINDGDVISIIGPSGTGKSTLIRCMNLLEKPTAGKVIVDGVDITAPGYDAKQIRLKMGMVFQSFNLFEHLTVIENIMLAPMELLHKSKQEAYDDGMRLLRQMELADWALSYPDELSGGQKQRVAIARTLAMDPKIILFDEPTSALDPTMVRNVESIIHDLAKSGKTMLIVTHEMRFARSICNRVFYMDEGGIYDDGTPEEIFDHPTKENTRRFIRQLKIMEVNIDRRDFDFRKLYETLHTYCFKNQIAARTGLHISLTLEELIQQILMPRLEDPKIRVSIEYSEQKDQTMITVQYNGERFDPADSDNQLSYTLVRHSVRSIHHEAISDGEFTNQVVMEIAI